MSEPIKKADLARHWKVSPAYVTQLFGRWQKKNPGAAELTFASLDEADQWRAIHAPPKPANEARRTVFAGKPSQSSPEKPAETAEKTRESSRTPQTAGQKPAGAGGDNTDASTPSPDIIDVETLITRGGDFDELMLRQAEEVPQIAYGLYRRACARGAAAEIANATKNWNDASKAGHAVREKFLEIQEKTRALISLDVVMDIVGTELQGVRARMLKLGERNASKANPENPALARAVIDAAIDEVFQAIETVTVRTEKELSVAP